MENPSKPELFQRFVHTSIDIAQGRKNWVRIQIPEILLASSQGLMFSLFIRRGVVFFPLFHFTGKGVMRFVDISGLAKKETNIDLPTHPVSRHHLHEFKENIKKHQHCQK